MNLQYKITLVLSLMLLVVFGAMALMIGEHFQDTLENQMGNNAMDMAVTIAQMDDVEQTLAYKLDYMPLHDKIEKIKSKTRFQYIIVMDMEGIQYSYPYTNGLGKSIKMVVKRPFLKEDRPMCLQIEMFSSQPYGHLCLFITMKSRLEQFLWAF